MSQSELVGLLTLSLVLATGSAEGGVDYQDKFSIFTNESTTVLVLVEAVDQETREVTLRDPQGGLITFTASEEVRNLAQLQPGDSVSAQYNHYLAIDVGGQEGPATQEFSAVDRASAGGKPGLSAYDTQILTATVEAIDLEANTFKLKWEDDSVEQYTAQNPENLKRVSVGDVVVITDTVSVDISIAEPVTE